MAVRNEAFLDIEGSLATRLTNSWLRDQGPLIQKIGRLASSGRFSDALDTIQQLNVEPSMRRQQSFIELMSVTSVLFGARDFKKASETSFTRKPLPGLVPVSAEALVKMLSSNMNDAIKKRATEMVMQEERGMEPGEKPPQSRLFKKSEELVKKQGFVRGFATAVTATGKAFINLGSSLHTSRLASWGHLVEAELDGASCYQVKEVLDSRTCPICMHMNGKKFPVGPAKARLEGQLGVENLDSLKSIAPWHGQSQKSILGLRALTMDQVIGKGMDTPPYHPLCRGILAKTDCPDDLRLSETVAQNTKDSVLEDIGMLGLLAAAEASETGLTGVAAGTASQGGKQVLAGVATGGATVNAAGQLIDAAGEVID